MKNTKQSVIILVLLTGYFFFLSSQKMIFGQTTQWVAPKEADIMKNPVADNVAATAEGKKLYVLNCIVCHGDKGKGDGIAATGLNPKPADHTSAKVQMQTDGAIFWKMTTGKPPMASYKDILTETQRWQLVNYIRTLKAPDKTKSITAKK